MRTKFSSAVCAVHRFNPRLHATVDERVVSGGPAFVAMMQSANFGKRNDLSLVRCAHWARLWGIFLQGQVGATAMIIPEIVFEQTVQVILAEHDDMIQTFAPYGTNQPFDVRGLSGRTRRNPNFLQSQSHGASLKFQAVDAIAVTEQVFRR
jgi:hypothetical protein